MEMTEGVVIQGWIVVTIRKIMDCGDYQKDNRWLRNWIVMEMTEGVIIQGWIVVTIRKIIGG